MTKDAHDPPSALALLSEAYDALDALDNPSGFNLVKSFRELVSNLNDSDHSSKLKEFAENSLWLSDNPSKQIRNISIGLFFIGDNTLRNKLSTWINEDLDKNTDLARTLSETLADYQVERSEFVQIISDYGHTKFGNTQETVNLSSNYLDQARLFARSMGVTNPSEQLLQGLALFEAEGTREQSLNIGDVRTLHLGMNTKP